MLKSWPDTSNLSTLWGYEEDNEDGRTLLDSSVATGLTLVHDKTQSPLSILGHERWAITRTFSLPPAVARKPFRSNHWLATPASVPELRIKHYRRDIGWEKTLQFRKSILVTRK